MPYANPSRAGSAAGRTALLVFAKAPVPGHCKTRLARGVGPVRAAVIYRRLLEHAVARASASGVGPVTLVCAPDTRHAFFHRLRRRYDVALARQACGDLGRRMHLAMRAALAEHDAVLLMGGDQPEIGGHMLARAAVWLEKPGRAWLGPTCDGGYWLIGSSRPEARLFQGLRWSTPRVSRQTQRRLQRVDLAYREAPPCRDVDTARDLRRLSRPLALTATRLV